MIFDILQKDVCNKMVSGCVSRVQNSTLHFLLFLSCIYSSNSQCCSGLGGFVPDNNKSDCLAAATNNSIFATIEGVQIAVPSYWTWDTTCSLDHYCLPFNCTSTTTGIDLTFVDQDCVRTVDVKAFETAVSLEGYGLAVISCTSLSKNTAASTRTSNVWSPLAYITIFSIASFTRS